MFALMLAGLTGCVAECNLQVVHTIAVVVPDSTPGSYTLDIGAEVGLTIACPEGTITDDGTDFTASCSSTGVTLSGPKLAEVEVSLDGAAPVFYTPRLLQAVTTCAESATRSEVVLDE